MIKPILTARTGTNADLFPDVIELYAKHGDRILDMTYGKGVFWRKIDTTLYQLTTNDSLNNAQFHYDCRQTGFESGSFDVVVFDPPYQHTSGYTKTSYDTCYNQNASTTFRNQKDVDAFYAAGCAEAHRLLATRGILIVKCQDTIESGRQHWTHLKIITTYGFHCEDLFVLMQSSTPAMSSKWTKQYHARKNHSYFIVLQKERK
jgi:16S rRNA G966 N2-methylase RsmD